TTVTTATGGDAGRGNAVVMRGEGLRVRRNPSVSELLARRMRHFVTHRPDASYERWEHTACLMASYLATWDAAGNRGTLAPVTRQTADTLTQRVREMGAAGQCLTRLVVLQATAGDVSALDEWARWIRAYQPTHLDDGWEHEAWFAPLWLFRSHPSV